MSLEAMIWALKKAPVESAQEQIVLISLADHAASDGTGAYPSQATISEYAGCTTRTVRTHEKAMRDRGLIRPGDNRMLSHIPADRRPLVWDLDLSRVREERAENISGRKLSVERPENQRRTTGKPASNDRKRVSDKPSRTVLEPSLNQREGDSQAHPTPSNADGRGTRLPDGWYPDRHVVESIKKKYPNVDLRDEHDKFTDYFLSVSGQKGVKRDWNATWRNWIRKAAEWQKGKPTQGRETKADRFKRMAQEKAMELAQQKEETHGEQLGSGHSISRPVQSISSPSREYPEFAG